MPPIDLLCILVLLTCSAMVINRYRRRQEQAAFRKVAIEHQMHYSPGDPLRLTPRVAAQIPLPGAAAVRVIDLLYRTDDQFHYYVFTAEYTIGVAGPKHRVRRAAWFTESRSTANTAEPIRMGAEELSLLEQYRELILVSGL